jgi:hypothetical protein
MLLKLYDKSLSFFENISAAPELEKTKEKIAILHQKIKS